MRKHPMSYTAFAPKVAPSPHGSWWLALDQDAFYQRAKVEQERLSGTTTAVKDKSQ